MEDFAPKLSVPQSYIIKGYRLQGKAPPYHLLITKETAMYKSSPVAINEALLQEARDLLSPASKITLLAQIKGARGLISVQGQIVKLSALKKIIPEREEVPMRNLTLGQNKARASLTLWREAAAEDLQVGSVIEVTHMKLRTSSDYGDQLQSTAFTKIEVVTNTLSQTTEVLGVTEGPAADTLELLVLDQEPVLVEQQMWEPLEELLKKDKLFVSVVIVGEKVKTIQAVDPQTEE
ncbi:uncharacterized protein LOC108246728 [Kryptolebias marmoratus]|uniref:uncharacterized protein LOC108246728 n=1 Tax=Kryptolebias marmoratus TaxID=37003 RepID=UPI0007F906DA|nr:uncharacterized protein LOC108246728 [Kryptolebias marmoratus]XP_037834695.1 uncharacterized protein LOC108246728 [Kryptolebias marmoratus]XP_037834696.1 uncharacterized protein LOC108246728 [Kryptolebias marmoratus]